MCWAGTLLIAGKAYAHPVWRQKSALLQCTGTLELAALGPTMLIFNLFTYIFTAITITTVRCDTSLGFLTHIVAHALHNQCSCGALCMQPGGRQAEKTRHHCSWGCFVLCPVCGHCVWTPHPGCAPGMYKDLFFLLLNIA